MQIARDPNVKGTVQTVLLFSIILGMGMLYDLGVGDGKSMAGVLTPLPYSLYAMEIVAFILTAAILPFLYRPFKSILLPWLACGIASAGWLVYWWGSLHWAKSDHGSVLEFLQYALGAHNYDKIDPSLQSMWPTFWRFQIPFVVTMLVGYAVVAMLHTYRKKAM